MCVECPDEPVDRRSFLATVAVAGVGLAAGADAIAEQPMTREWKALDDPDIVHRPASFKSGNTEAKGYLARPKKEGTYPAVILLHGNPGASDDMRIATAQIAQAGFGGLLVDWGSRDPLPESKEDQAKWRARITGYAFWKLVLGDIQAAADYLRAQAFVRNSGVGLVGFCGGGKQALLFATTSKDVKAVVAFYASARYREFRHKTDPVPELIDVVKEIRAPVQGHYGLLDRVAIADDAREFEAALRAQRTPVEMHYYEKAGHSFYNVTRRRLRSGFRFLRGRSGTRASADDRVLEETTEVLTSLLGSPNPKACVGWP